MKRILETLRITALLGLLTIAAAAVAPAPSHADTEIEGGGVICWDSGHVCHIQEDDGTTAHHGKVKEF
jgi:hypothetical protein